MARDMQTNWMTNTCAGSSAALWRRTARGDDITTDALVPARLTGSAVIIAKEAGVVAGLPVAAAVFRCR